MNDVLQMGYNLGVIIPDTFFWILSTIPQAVVALVAFMLVAIIHKINEYKMDIREIGSRYPDNIHKWALANNFVQGTGGFATDLEAIDWARRLMELYDNNKLKKPKPPAKLFDLSNKSIFNEKVFDMIRGYDESIENIKEDTKDAVTKGLFDAMGALILLSFAESMFLNNLVSLVYLFTTIIVLGAIMVLFDVYKMLIKYW